MTQYYYSVDVEAVATGTDHNSRAVAQISLVVSVSMDSLSIYAI